MKLIVEKAGRDCIEQRDAKNHTPLILATMGGHGEVVNYLLSVGGKRLACCSLTPMSHSQLSELALIGLTDRQTDCWTEALNAEGRNLSQVTTFVNVMTSCVSMTELKAFINFSLHL